MIIDGGGGFACGLLVSAGVGEVVAAALTTVLSVVGVGGGT